MIRHLTVDEALSYFWHEYHGDMRDSDWMTFRACEGVCGAFHQHLWPGVWMGHLGALREARGNTVEPAKAILRSFAAEVQAERIIGWVREDNRATLAMCRRAGFEIDGVLPLKEPVVMVGWTCGRSD